MEALPKFSRESSTSAIAFLLLSLEMSLKYLSLNLAYQLQKNILYLIVMTKREGGKKKKVQSGKRLQDLDDSRNWLANCYERLKYC